MAGTVNSNTGRTGNVNIPGPLHDTSDYNIVAFTGDLYDESQATNQKSLNAYFKDVSPERDGTRGQKYIILRPGSTLQSQINGAAIYEVRDNFDLDNGILTIPSGSTLYFKGGSLTNGTVALNSTSVYPSYNRLDNVTVTGNPAVGTIKIDNQNRQCYWNGTTWVSSEVLVSEVSTSLTNYVDTEIAKITPVEHRFTASYQADKDYQKLFHITTTNGYVIMAVAVTVMGKTWNDILYYSCSVNKDRNYFYTNCHQYFYESRASDINSGPVCMPTKKSPMAPAATVKIQIIKSSGNIVWFDETPEYVSARTYDVLNSKILAEELDFSMSTYCETDNSGNLVSVSGDPVTVQDNELYTVNASASSGAFTLPTRTYENVNIYCFGSGVATLGEQTLNYNDGDIINVEGTHMSIVTNPKDYYTKEEVDALIGTGSVSGMNYRGTKNSIPQTAEAGDVCVITSDFSINNTDYYAGTAVVYNGSLWKAMCPPGLESNKYKASIINNITTNDVNYPTTAAVVNYAEKKKIFDFLQFYYLKSRDSVNYYKIGYVGVFKERTSNVCNFVKDPSKTDYWTNPLMSSDNYGYYANITDDVCYVPISYFTSTAGTVTLKCWFDNDTDQSFTVEIIEDTRNYCYVIKQSYCPDVVINGTGDIFEVYLKLVGKAGKTLHMQFVELVNNLIEPSSQGYNQANKFAVRVKSVASPGATTINMEYTNQTASNYPLELAPQTTPPTETNYASGYGYNLIDFNMLKEFLSCVDACDDSSEISITNTITNQNYHVKPGSPLFEMALATHVLEEDHFVYNDATYNIYTVDVAYKFDFVDMWVHASSEHTMTTDDIDAMWNS